MLAIIAIILGIISLIIDAIVKHWYLVAAYILILCLPGIIRRIKNSCQKASVEKSTHNGAVNTQEAENGDEKCVHQEYLDSISKDIHLSSIKNKEKITDVSESLPTGSSTDKSGQSDKAEEHPIRLEDRADVAKSYEATTVGEPLAKAPTLDMVNEKYLIIRSIPVYCSKQKEYGTGYIININPNYKVITIRFPSGEHLYAMSYIGKTIFAVSGLEDTNKVKKLVDLISKELLTGNQSLSGRNYSYSPLSRYHSEWETSLTYHPDKPSVHFYYVGEVPCFSEEWISRRVSVERTKARGKALYETNGVLSLQRSESSYQAVVRGSSGFNYNCRFKISSDGKIDTWYCGCPAFSKYPKACKHLVAAFYAAGEEE